MREEDTPQAALYGAMKQRQSLARDRMQRVYAFYEKYPVGPCPQCGRPSRISRASLGPCLACLGANIEDEDPN